MQMKWVVYIWFQFDDGTKTSQVLKEFTVKPTMADAKALWAATKDQFPSPFYLTVEEQYHFEGV